MELLDVMKKRFSVRKYKEQQVEPEKLAKILEAAHVAPTATNAQPVRLIVVQSEEGRAKLDKAARLYGAPTVIIVCADHDKAWVRKYDQMQTTDIDASILTDHMMLEATEQGLGSLWVCWFDPRLSEKSSNFRIIWNRSICWHLVMRIQKKKDRIVIKQSESVWMNW